MTLNPQQPRPDMNPCRQCGWPFDVGADGLCDNCRKLKRHPDTLSHRREICGVPFEDAKSLDESDRIKLIVRRLRDNPGKRIAVIVDTGPGYEDKGDRYIKAIKAMLPEVKLFARGPGPVSGTESLILTHGT